MFDVHGAKRIRRDKHGDLVLKMGDDEIRWHKPVVYQEKNGTRQEIAARYAITNANRVAFEIAKYDTSRPLYIDPLIYSTYLGGSGHDVGSGIAVDSGGNTYVTGSTCSTDFPTTDPLQPAYGGSACDNFLNGDAFVAKINPSGSALVYSTYLGGSGRDRGYGIAVDSLGNAYVTGSTCSTDFPTMNPLQPAYGGGCSPYFSDGDAFVTKINPSGSALVYSTYLGGSSYELGNAIAVNSAGSAYVTGTTCSTDFPTMNPLQPAYGGSACDPVSSATDDGDAFVAKINPSGSALVYSTYLGGSGADGGYGIAVDSGGNAYVTGSTCSTDFPTMNPLQPAYGGGCYFTPLLISGGDAFVAKINPSGSALVYSTYLGGSGTERGYGIAVDTARNAYVTGNTCSTDFPTKNALQPSYGGGGLCGRSDSSDAFVAKLKPTGSALVYSTYLGGSGFDSAYAIAVDSSGDAYVTGLTQNVNYSLADFPVTLGAFQTTCKPIRGCQNAFVTEITPSGSALVYSTYLGDGGEDQGGGIAVDSAHHAYITGSTSSINFPTKNPLQAANAGRFDAFLTKIDVRAVPSITLSSSLNPSIYGQAVTFVAALTSTIGAPPDGETVKFMKGATVLGTGALSGGSASFTTSTLPAGTNSIKAVYDGDSNFFGGNSNVVKQVVNKATTTTTLTSSLDPSNFGQLVTFTAAVTPQFSGTVQGTVTFYDGTTALKTVVLSNKAVAKYATSMLSSGSHSITATYNDRPNFIGSSASLTQTVN